MKDIDNYNVISTKSGDQGSSRNYSNDLVSKSDLLFDVLGNIDELSSLLGVVYHYTSCKEEIKFIQKRLEVINSLVATNYDDTRFLTLKKITQDDISYIEQLEQLFLKEKSIEGRFYLPGSETNLEGAYFDLARSVCRRAERSLVKYHLQHKIKKLDCCLQYVNRLSDLLFIISKTRE